METKQQAGGKSDNKYYVDDIDGNRVKKAELGSKGITDFGHIVIEALYGGYIKEGAPSETLQELIEHIGALCLIHGVIEFQNEMAKCQGNLAQVITSYDRTALGYMQECANQLYEVEKDPEREMKPCDVKMLDFLKSVGLAHMPSPFRSPDKDGVLAGLRQMAESLGMPDGMFEMLTGGELSKDGMDEDPECDCPGCELRRERDSMKATPHPEGASTAVIAQLAEAMREAGEEKERGNLLGPGGRYGVYDVAEGDEEASPHPDGVFAGLPGAKAMREAYEARDEEDKQRDDDA